MSDRIKVVPVHSAWGAIQGWAIIYRNRELEFFGSRVKALNFANWAAREIYAGKE